MYADEIVYAKSDAVPAHRHHARRAGASSCSSTATCSSLRRRVPLPRGARAPGDVAAPARRARVLVLGGGDGLALREMLRHPSVEQVTLVDLDPAMTALSRRVPAARRAQPTTRSPIRACTSSTTTRWSGSTSDARPFDAVIVDFPDPNNFALGKLYTTRFYRLLRARLDARRGGRRAVHVAAVRAAVVLVHRPDDGGGGLRVRPYQRGAVVRRVGLRARAPACRSRRRARRRAGLRYLDDATLASMFVLPADMAPVPVEINRLDNQVLVRYYEEEWKRWE